MKIMVTTATASKERRYNNSTMNNTDIIKIVESIESQYADIDWVVWQQICETLEKRSHQI